MLVATSDRTFGSSRMRSTVVLERRFRAHVLHRDRILFDSKFNPAPRRGAEGVTIYIVNHGSFQVDGGPVSSGPIAYVLDQTEFERVGKTSSTFRSWGAPNVTIELRIMPEDVRAPIGLAAGPLALGPRSWGASAALAAACTDARPIEAEMRDLLIALAEDDVIERAVERTVPATESEPFVRLWGAIRELYASYSASASASDLADATGLSLRQLGRDLESFTRTFGLGDGFRDAARVLRLRAAIVMLSAPDGTATEVAELVGYGSLDAMARAFRDAMLPPPSVVRDAIVYRDG